MKVQMKSHQKLQIKLHEVPEEGREYTYNKATGELNESLRDLIENNDYHAKLFIKPLNHKDYSLTGTLQTRTVEICSLCGETFQFPTTAKINEILIPAAQNKEKEKQSRSNHFSELDDSTFGVSEYKGDTFDMGEHLHEAVALSVPFNPKPKQNDDGSCSVCLKSFQFGDFNYDENMGVVDNATGKPTDKPNPFNVLKDFKVKSVKSN